MGEAHKKARARQAPPRTREGSRAHTSAVCNVCKKKKPLTEFHKNGSGVKFKANDPRRYKPTCGQCVRSVAADPGEFGGDRKPKRNKRGRDRELVAAAKQRIRVKTRIACLKYLAKEGCALCGERDPRVLEFDHLDPSKKRHHIATLISGGYAWSSEILRREIRKCRILCANCHRKHTIEQRDYYSHDDVRAALKAIYADYDVTE